MNDSRDILNCGLMEYINLAGEYESIGTEQAFAPHAHLRQYEFVTFVSGRTYEFTNTLWHDTSSAAPDDASSCLL